MRSPPWGCPTRISHLQGSSLAPEDGTDTLSRNVAKKLYSTLRTIPKKSRYHLHGGESLKSRKYAFINTSFLTRIAPFKEGSLYVLGHVTTGARLCLTHIFVFLVQHNSAESDCKVKELHKWLISVVPPAFVSRRYTMGDRLVAYKPL
jgi:hypothetical protein